MSEQIVDTPSCGAVIVSPVASSRVEMRNRSNDNSAGFSLDPELPPSS